MEFAEKFLQSGFVYVNKRDKHFRPVFIIQLSKCLGWSKAEIGELGTMMNYLLTYVIEKAILPTKSETILIIMDLANVGYTQMPLTAIKNFLGTCQTNFRGRLFKFIMINVGMMLRGTWSTMRMLVDEFTANKVTLMGSDYKTRLPEWIQVDQLEMRFGGILPDKKDNFFPPDLSVEGETMLTRQEYEAAIFGETKAEPAEKVQQGVPITVFDVPREAPDAEEQPKDSAEAPTDLNPEEVVEDQPV